MPLCCRAENGIPENIEDAAGLWGGYNCDPPHRTITKMFEYLKEEIKPDVIFFTGDMTPHNVWENSEPEVIYYQNVIYQEMIDTFGDDVFVYPLMGNHDTYPVNV
jgi:sphingomyelin phosphodiesterase